MTASRNDELLMTNDEVITDDADQKSCAKSGSLLVIQAFLSHWSFVIGHFSRCGIWGCEMERFDASTI